MNISLLLNKPCAIMSDVSPFTDSLDDFRISLLPTCVEEFGHIHRKSIERAVRTILGTKYEVSGIYVVGSYCFNLSDPGDLDIVVTSPDGHSSEDYRDVPTLRRSVWEMGNRVGDLLGTRVDLKVIPSDGMSDRYRGCDLGFMVPSYDVLTGELNHKVPYATLYFSFVWNFDKKCYTTYMRDKQTFTMSVLF